MLDLIKAYDSVPFDHLADKGRRLKYNLYLLRLSIASYMLARVLEVEGCCSVVIHASRGLAAGSVLATIELRLLLIDAGDRLVKACLYCRLTLYVDDATVETVCVAGSIVHQHSSAVNRFVGDLQDLRLQFSDTKNVTFGSTCKLADAAVGASKGYTVKTASRVTSLGSGLGAGTRRNMLQVRRRLKVFASRRSRFRMLRSSGVRTDRLLRTGGIASMLFGQRALGVSNATLLSQRRAAAAATCVRTCGADLDLTLMLADGTSHGGADPAFEAHQGVLHMWALAIWEEWVPSRVLSIVLRDAKARLQRAKSHWSVVYGPAAALVATASRIGWQVDSPTLFVTDLGVRIDLGVGSPAFLLKAVGEAVARWRWRRIEHRHPSLYSGGAGRGASWRPVLKVLRAKDSPEWGPEHKASLKSVMCNRQWPQQRLCKAGLVQDNRCQLCLGRVDGDQVGTLLHRWVCPALAAFRERHLPRWIEDYLRQNGHSVNGAIVLAVTRGLFPAPACPVRDSSCFDTFEWHVECVDIPAGCVVFTDGSLIDGLLPNGWQSLGWAFAVVDCDGVLVAAAFGVPPRWLSTIQGAELWAVCMALQHVAFPEKLLTDCDSVRLGLKQPREWASSSKRRLARLWTLVHNQVEGDHDLVHWMPAHTSESSIGQKMCSDGVPVSQERWCANQIVDLLAKDAADGHRVNARARSRLIHDERQLAELLVFLGRLTHAANSFKLADGTVIRDSEKVAKLRPKKRIPKKAFEVKPTPERRVSACLDDWIQAWRRGCSNSLQPPPESKGPASKATAFKHAGAAIAMRQQAAFEVTWRESRSLSLQPKVGGPSAAERMLALRQRLLARSHAGSCCEAPKN